MQSKGMLWRGALMLAAATIAMLAPGPARAACNLITMAGQAPGSIHLCAGGSNVTGMFWQTETMPLPSASSEIAIVPGASTAMESGHVLKAGPGNLYSIYVTSSSAAGYLMTFNATTVPADGAVTPIECVPILPTQTVSIDFSGAPPDAYPTGISVAFSTTGCFTKTGSATAFFKWRVQ